MDRTTLKNQINTVSQGQAGVFRVASELLLRGMKPYFPAVDDHGVDLILESGVRIQVKSTHYRSQRGTNTFAYSFNLCKMKVSYRTRTLSYVKRQFSDACDVVVLWGITEDRFWIVPASLLNKPTSIAITSRAVFKDIDIEEVRRLLATGISQNMLAKDLGVNRTTLNKRLKHEPKHFLAMKVRKYEGRWDIIHELEELRKPQGQLIEMPTQHEEAVAV